VPLIDITTADGPLEIYFEVHGPTDPVQPAGAREPRRVLNISGSGSDLRTSYPERSPLNRAFEVVHYDQRGLGQSGKPAEPYTMRQYADDAAALINALGWDSCAVVGTSFGGMVAQHLAIHHSHLVQRLVLNCTSPGGTKPSFPLDTLEALDVEARIELRMGLLDNRWDPGRDDPIPGLGRFYDIMIERAREPRDADSQRGYLAQLAARAGHDATPSLHRIEVPTLVCAGEFDDLAPLPNSMALFETIPNAELRVFDGGHYFLLQDRTAFPAIIEFLSG
jgi:3-oxoadipate enol-lactonase